MPVDRTDQHQLFLDVIQRAIDGGVTHGLLPGEAADLQALIMALSEKLGEQIAKFPKRDDRDLVRSLAMRRMREVAEARS